MLRLRTTTALSLLALLIGSVGVDWLSGLTDDWIGPPPRSAALAMARRPASRPVRRIHPRPHVLGAQAEAVARDQPPPPPLVPLSTPPDPARYADLRGHLDGRVVLAIATDGQGMVTRARVARSSGDPVLDAYAVATVQHWRFAVPAGAAAGVQGELPMRFDSGPPATPP